MGERIEKTDHYLGYPIKDICVTCLNDRIESCGFLKGNIRGICSIALKTREHLTGNQKVFEKVVKDNIQFQIVNQTGAKVLLYSGGMDSFIISKLENYDVLLYLDIGSRYSQVEKEWLIRQNLKNLVIDNRLQLGDVELPDGIVPMRNFFFAMIGTFYGDYITLGATSGDRIQDKSKLFAIKTSTILSELHAPFHWIPDGRKIDFNVAFKDFSKVQLIHDYLDKGFSFEDLLTKSFTCYAPIHDKPCGICKACARKWIALYHFTYTVERKKLLFSSFVGNPAGYWEGERIDAVIKNQKEKNEMYRGCEDDDTIKAWELYKKDEKDLGKILFDI